MIADGLVDVANWLIQHIIYPLFPSNYPFLSFSTYSGILNGVKTDVIFAFSAVDKFFPISLLLIFLSVILTAELILVAIKAGMWILNLVRGSGA